MTTFTIANLTFREAARRKILISPILLGLAFLIVYGIGFYYVNKEIGDTVGRNLLENNEIRNFLFMAGMYAVNFLVVIMAVLTSVATLSGEISTGTIQTLVAKPVQRWEIVVGKWIGFTFMLTLYLLVSLLL